MRASQDEKKTILSRRDLYELVWSTPVTKLAEQFGISDRGLAKICERHRVPSPPRGYWAKLDAGAKPKRAIFVDTSDEALNVIKINSTLSAMPPEARLIVEKARAERKAQKASKSAKRATEQPKLEPVDQVHPLIAATAKTIRKQRGPGMVHVSGAGLMSLRLGPDGVERVLSFLDTLIRRLEGNGLAVSLADKGMKVALGIDDAVFTVSERTTWELHEPTEEELAAEKRRQAKIEKARLAGSWSIDWSSRAYPERDEIPRGELVLQVEGWWDESGGAGRMAKHSGLKPCWTASLPGSRYCLRPEKRGGWNVNSVRGMKPNWRAGRCSLRNAANGKRNGGICCGRS